MFGLVGGEGEQLRKRRCTEDNTYVKARRPQEAQENLEEVVWRAATIYKGKSNGR